MDSFLVGQAAFWWAQYKIKPAEIVNKIIEIVVDIIVPPRDDPNQRSRGPHNWIKSQFDNLDRTTEKLQREGEIRADLRRWDRENPQMNHEVIIRTIASGLFSILVTNVYVSFCRRIRDSGSSAKGRY